VQRLRVAAERARRTLTEHSVATMQVVWRDRAWEHDVTAEEFEKLAAGLLARLRDPVLKSLRDSEIPADSLKEIVLVGGATRMPVVRRIVTRMFGRFPSMTVHPDEAVALGAAIQAGLKARDSALKEVAVTDVCPYTLGVDSAERGPNGVLRAGIFSPIIERNVVVPASRSKIFSTLQDRQPKVVFNVYQGESRDVADNIHLGRVEIPVPAKPAGEVAVECRFSYDVNGLLEVDLQVLATGERRQLVIIDEDEPSGDGLEARRAALAKLKIHPRDADPNRAALARAKRCYESFVGDRRERIGNAMAAFEAVLDLQDPRAAEPARKELVAALDALEGESFL